MPWMKDILSFYDEKSHAISHKKLGTMMPRMTHLQYHDEVNDPASRDFLRCVAIVWFVWIAGFLVGTAANIDGVCLLPMTHDDALLLTQFWLQQSGYCGRSLSGHLHRHFYTQTILHTDTFTHRRFYTQMLLHTETFAHRSFYTQKFLHRKIK